MMIKPVEIRLRPGERGLLVGQTGSGKTAHAAWQARSTRQKPVIIMDTKIDDIFAELPDENESLEIIDSAKYLDKLLRKRGNACPDYILVRPPVVDVVEPKTLDEYLTQVWEHGSGAFVVIDEAYQLHEGGRAGPGLVGLLTRGRARGITTLVCSQRPVWLSRFCLTECQRFYLYWLADKADIARLAQVIPGYERNTLQPYHFGVYDGVSLRTFKPIPILKDQGYVPESDNQNLRWY